VQIDSEHLYVSFIRDTGLLEKNCAGRQSVTTLRVDEWPKSAISRPSEISCRAASAAPIYSASVLFCATTHCRDVRQLTAPP
jgi:hypothetical protein